jgi:DNA-binding winged helix-turn-helix (wHTH) protein
VALYGPQSTAMSTDAARTIFRFADFELDTVAYELRRKGCRLRLPRQPMDLLLLLVERPRELVSRQEIARRLWAPGVCVDLDAVIHTAVLRIRQVLGESRESPRFLETVSGKGYRFIAPVERLSVDQPQPSSEVPASADSLQNVRRHNLPAELTSFVGRRKELTELRRLLTGSRLLSLTGDGV